MSRLRDLSWELVALSLLWLAALSTYVATLGLHFYFDGLMCLSDPEASPGGETYLSLWPPGPGCSFLQADDQPPSFAWLAAALMLLASGGWLWTQARRKPDDWSTTETDVL